MLLHATRCAGKGMTTHCSALLHKNARHGQEHTVIRTDTLVSQVLRVYIGTGVVGIVPNFLFKVHGIIVPKIFIEVHGRKYLPA